MATRFRGTMYKALLPRLPRNLVVFDGHCLMSQARVRYVLERNFNYFRMIPYFMGDEGDMAEQLDFHRMHFMSLDSSEAEELERVLVDKKGAAAKGRPAEVVLLFVEKVPSKSASFLRGRRALATSATAATSGARGGASSSSSSGGATDELFQNPTTIDDSYASLSGKNVIKKRHQVNASEQTIATHALRHPEETDLLVSTNFAAMCRIGMHLDRRLVRNGFRVVYWLTPKAVGDWWFSKYVAQRRGVIWGTSEADAVSKLGIIEGMKERRWSWRTRFPL